MNKDRISRVTDWYVKRHNGLLSFLWGCMYCTCQPPFNHEFSTLFVCNPLLSFFILIPFFFVCTCFDKKKSYMHLYLFGVGASLVQVWWLVNVTIEGLWLTIIGGMVVLILALALLFLLQGTLFRCIYKRFPRFYLVLYPCVWVFIDYCRSLGEISFPWGFLGYNLIPYLPVAQLCSITGIWGLTWLVVCGNCCFHAVFCTFLNKGHLSQTKQPLMLFTTMVLCVVVWGSISIQTSTKDVKKLNVGILQSNLDPKHWNSKVSLDTSMIITEKMIASFPADSTQVIILPESGVYCYLEREEEIKQQVINWSTISNADLLFGTLHAENKKNSMYTYNIYNATVFLKKNTRSFERYFKIKLLPFSEALPFQGIFPILSRLNLGQSDFSRGTEEKIFRGSDSVAFAPFSCYEILYPDFVCRRAKQGADLLVNVTNDSWWGKSPAPYIHAVMARTRSIETGLPLVRCANSGISFASDGHGRLLRQTGLFQRIAVSVAVPLYRVTTVYKRFGDWFVLFCTILVISSIAFFIYKNVGIKNSIKNDLDKC